MRNHTEIIPTPTEPAVHRSTVGEHAAVADVLAQAFFEDDVFRWCLPDDHRRRQVLPRFSELTACAVLAHGESELAGTSAAALWVPPGQSPVADDERHEFEFAVGELFGDDGARAFSLMEMLEVHHPREPNRFLWFLGVRPDAQGNGLGSALLRSTLARCDREGVAAYLDATSPDNRRLYERHGFEVVAERSVAGSPPLWAMWREPRDVTGAAPSSSSRKLTER